MTMKTIKLMIGMTLAAVSVMSAFMESADAQFRGVSYSRSNNVPDLSFSIVSETSSGASITDELDGATQNNSGLFRGAIENFRYLGSAVPNPSTGLSPLEFRFDVGDLSTTLNGNIVRYTVLAPERFELTDSDSLTTSRPTTIINPGPVYSFDLDVSSFSNEDRARYVNDLGFIVEQNVYQRSGFLNERFIESTIGYNLALPTSSGFEFTNIPDTTPNTPIPEPSSILGVLALGALSAGSVLKRKLPQM